MRAVFGSSPISAIVETDFPQPDSPTIANTSLRRTSYDTPRTASTRPSSVGNDTFRSSTFSNTSSPSAAVAAEPFDGHGSSSTGS